MPTSRTTPTKLATAPTFGSRERARISAPASKSCAWTEIFIRRLSSPGDRWKERHLVARLDRSGGLHHVLVYRHAHQLAVGERQFPGATAPAQVGAQRRYGAHARGQLDFLARSAKLLAQCREV